MIGRLNHVAIAVHDIARAAEVYRRVLGAKVSEPAAQPAHGVTTVFITLPNTKIELIAPLGDQSPIAKFLDRNPTSSKRKVHASSATGSRRWAPTASRCCSCTPRIFAERS
jgi:methylmalonyl-CoA epimerase